MKRKKVLQRKVVAEEIPLFSLPEIRVIESAYMSTSGEVIAIVTTHPYLGLNFVYKGKATDLQEQSVQRVMEYSVGFGFSRRKNNLR